MKNIYQTISIILAVVVVLLTVKLLFTQSPQIEEIATNSNPTYQTIISRTSIRSYSDKSVSSSDIEKMLRAGMAAPTAGNKQPWAFVVVSDKEILQKLGATLPYASFAANAPLAIVACGDLSKGFTGKESEYWIQDVSASSQNILLAAHSLNLGAVWTGVYPMDERVAHVSELLSLPSHIIPLNVIVIGYPQEATPPAKDKWKPDNIRYNKW